jgi:hypothetical protein
MCDDDGPPSDAGPGLGPCPPTRRHPGGDGPKGVIPDTLRLELTLILTLKDPLTHPGEPVDWDLVHDVLQHRLTAFTAFNRQVVLYLDNLGL